MNHVIQFISYLESEKKSSQIKVDIEKYETLINIFKSISCMANSNIGLMPDQEIRNLFELFCVKAKKIIDVFDERLINNVYLKHFNGIRNNIVHHSYTMDFHEGGINLYSYKDGALAFYNKHYFNDNGTINIKLFIVYFTSLIARESMPEKIGNLDGVLNDELINDLQVFSIFKLDDTHDDYINKIEFMMCYPANDFIYEDKKYIGLCEKSLEWFFLKSEGDHQIEIMNSYISLGIFTIDNSEKAISYLFAALDMIDNISDKYNFVWIYRAHIYKSLSEKYFNLKNKKSALRFSLASIEYVKAENRIHPQIEMIFRFNLSSAYSLYKSHRELKQLEKCFSLLDDAVANGFSELEKYACTIIHNYIKASIELKKTIDMSILDRIESFMKDSKLKNKIGKDKFLLMKENLFSYYLEVHGDGEKIIDSINYFLKYKVYKKDNKKIFIFKFLLYQQYLKIGKKYINLQDELKRKVAKLDFTKEESMNIDKILNL